VEYGMTPDVRRMKAARAQGPTPGLDRRPSPTRDGRPAGLTQAPWLVRIYQMVASEREGARARRTPPYIGTGWVARPGFSP